MSALVHVAPDDVFEALGEEAPLHNEALLSVQVTAGTQLLHPAKIMSNPLMDSRRTKGNHQLPCFLLPASTTRTFASMSDLQTQNCMHPI